MSDMVRKKLRVVCQSPVSGMRPVGGVTAEGEGIPSLGGENVVSSGGMSYDNVNLIPRSFFEAMPKGKLQRNDVLINKDGAQTGKVGFYSGDFPEAAVNEHLFIMRPRDDGLDPEFLYYSLLNPDAQRRIARRITGSAQPGLNSQFVDAVDILVPDRPTQLRVAAILRAVDASIQDTEALIAKYEHIEAGMMHDLLSRGITPRGRLRRTHVEAPDLYKPSALGPIPNDWEAMPLSQMFSRRVERGIRGLPVMAIAMGKGLVERSSIDRRVDTNLAPEQHALVRAGDIAYNMMRMWQGVLGRATTDCLVSPAYVVMEPNRHLLSKYAEYMMSTRESIALFKRMSYGIVDDRLRLYYKDMVRIQMAIPSKLSEQSLIVERIESQSDLIASSRSKAAKMRAIKEGLMSLLLSVWCGA